MYRAFDLFESRPVALKVLFHSDRASRERFRREAETTLSLEHPHLVRAFAAGQAPDGRRFIAYELLHGETLKARLARLGPESFLSVARFAEQILSGLAAAHDAGVIHRDIKPSNVFVCAHNGGFVKLLDFGICRRNGAATVSPKNDMLGTPRYMSPEQLSPGPLTPASDLFSLGLVMAELLTGSPVYGGTPGETLIARLLPEPTPLARQVLDSPLGPVIRCATEKMVTNRYTSAHEMLRDLKRSLVETPPPSGIYSKVDSTTLVDYFDEDDTVRISA